MLTSRQDLERELNETLALARKTIDTDPQQVIRDCSLLHNKLGRAPFLKFQESIYTTSTLGDAETCLLIAHGLGGMEGAVALNLANLAAMRGDQRLALHWLERSPTATRPSQLEKVRSVLFPNGAPKASDNPFQVNLDQRAPGHFMGAA